METKTIRFVLQCVQYNMHASKKYVDTGKNVCYATVFSFFELCCIL